MNTSIRRIDSFDHIPTLRNCLISKVRAVKFYHILETRNQWVNWNGDTDIVGSYWGRVFSSLDEATKAVEKARTPGSQFQVEEAVALLFSSDKFSLLVCDFNSDSPFSDFISKPIWEECNDLHQISVGIPSSKYRTQYFISHLSEFPKDCSNDELFYSRSSSAGGKKNGLAWSLKNKGLNCGRVFAFVKAFNGELNKSKIKAEEMKLTTSPIVSEQIPKQSQVAEEKTPPENVGSLVKPEAVLGGVAQVEDIDLLRTLNAGQSAYLYTWNPNKWKWSDLQDAIYRVNNAEDYDIYWSCGVRKNLAVGDIFFLMRLGVEPKGVVGCGYISTLPYPLPHWDEVKSNAGITALRTNIIFKALSDEPIFPLSFLHSKYPSYNWTPEVGGVIIPHEIYEELWGLVQGNSNFSFTPSTTQEIKKYAEGKVKLVTYKTYDRSADARNKCVDYYGYDCSVCGFNYESAYGDQGKDFIEVHHLKKIADIAHEYEINPIADLRPVCANCHRMLHRKKLTLSIEELKLAIVKL